MRSVARIGYSALEASGALALWRALAPRPVVLTYHNVIGAGLVPRGEASLHLPADQFVAQMEWIASRFEVVSLQEVANAMIAPKHRRPLLAISFDDAYRGVFKYAIPILQRLKFPATVMVVQSAADSPKLFWWDVVAEAKPQRDRNGLRAECGGRGAVVMDVEGIVPGTVDLPDEYWPADWALLRGVQCEAVDYGAHTQTHPMLTSLRPDERAEELLAPRLAMAEALGKVPDVLAYPYGDWNHDVASAAAQAGYRVAVTTDRKSSDGGPDLMSIPRQTISAGVTLPAFAAAASHLRWRR